MAKRFQFRFESLLQLRMQEREMVGKEVTDADRAIEILQQQSTEIEARRAAVRESSNRQRNIPMISVDRLLNEGRYDLQLVAQLSDLAAKTEQVAGERERRLARLREADSEVRRLERLKERQQEEWNKRQMAAEQATLDEIAAARFLRQAREVSVFAGDVDIEE